MIFLLDKPTGMSSHLALQKAKRLFQATKAGHTGSLDPLATGMLPLCFGEATKFSRFLFDADKCYVVTIRLGVTTTTGDSEGEVLETKPVPALTLDDYNDMLARFHGPQLQIPPMFSALKHQGKPLYQLARQGKVVERASREINIKRCVLEGVEHKEDGTFLTLTIECSKGTYIRTLTEDMGHYLRCGAHVVALRRLWVEAFQSYPMMTLAALETLPLVQRTQHLLPIKTVLSYLLPVIELSVEQAFCLMRGQIVQYVAGAIEGWVTLVTLAGEFLGVGELCTDGRLIPKRLIQQV